MAEVQAHGFDFEGRCIAAITGIPKSQYQNLLKNKYTASMDIEAGILSDYNYSFKTTKSDSVDCADILRFMNHCCNTPFILVVGKYTQIGNYKRFHTIYEFNITPDHYSTLWANLKPEHVQEFVKWVTNIPKGIEAVKEYRPKWRSRRNELTKIHGKGIFNIGAKINGIYQRRVQCSTTIKRLTLAQIPFTIHTVNYKGLALPYDIESSERTFQES